MTKSSKSTIKPTPSNTSLLPTLGAAGLQAGLPIGGGHESFESAQAIGQQVFKNRLRQAGMAAQGEHAEQVSNRVTLRTAQHYNDWLQAEMALRDRPRDARIQADFEAFVQFLRQQQANSLLAIRNATVDAIENTAAEPVHAPTPADREIVITEEPSGIAKFFGARTRTTRISR